MDRNYWLLLIGCLLGIAKLGSASDHVRQQPAQRVPVLLELFTSEGCSSCPPADKLLQKLDREQPLNGAELIVLSEHVDYWNHLGWADPFSSPQSSKRQQDYALHLESEVYTPQVVVGGRRQVVGSDGPGLERAVEDSIRAIHVPVSVTAKRDGEEVDVHIEVGPLPESKAGSVYLALAADQARSHVVRGENAGRELEHVAVVESLVRVAGTPNGSTLQKDVRTEIPALSRTGSLRVVVFIQESGSMHILGAGEQKL